MFATARLRELGKDGEKYILVNTLNSGNTFSHKTLMIQDPVSQQIYFIKDIEPVNINIKDFNQVFRQQQMNAISEVAAQNFLHSCLPETQPVYEAVL